MKFCLLSNSKNTVWDTNESKIDTIFDIVSSPGQADIWVANQESILRDHLEKTVVSRRKKPKACILWTHEPYFSTTVQTQMKIYDCPVHIFNIWNGRALKQNGTFLFQNYPTSLPLKPIKKTGWTTISGCRQVCALMTYPKSNAVFTQERLSYAISGHENRLIDIYGKGWPTGISIENSRDGEWWKSKPGILERYDYNLALENCIKPYYVTEKLWDSILNLCLPIYADNTTIYKDFPPYSFYDVNDYRDKNQLWEKIRNTSLLEWNTRFQLCWESMDILWKRNQESKETFWQSSIEEIQATIENLT
jgi:hypothetical protein